MIPHSLGDLEGNDKDKLNFPLHETRDIDMLFPGAFESHSLDFNEVFKAPAFEHGFMGDTSILDTTLFPPQFGEIPNPEIGDVQDFDFLNETYPNDLNTLPIKTEVPVASTSIVSVPRIVSQPEMPPIEPLAVEPIKPKRKSRKGTQKKTTKEKARKRKQKVAENVIDAAKDVTDDSTREQKRQDRLMRNRASAQLSRERKKRYMKQLESQLKDLTSANANLSSQVIRLTVENNKLKEHLRRIESQRGMSPTLSSETISPYDLSDSPTTDPESPLGFPLSPSSQSGSESSGPPLSKRQRTMGGTINYGKKTPIRTGVVLLALVVSFGIFCSLLGIIPDQNTINRRDSTPAITFRGRALQGVSEETQALVDGLPQLPSTTSSPSVVVIPPSESKTLDTGAKEKMAMVSLLSLSEGRSNTDQYGKAVDIYSQQIEQKGTPSYDELLMAYKKILLSSNFSLEHGSSYLFCPSPVQIQSSLFPSRPSITYPQDGNETNPSVRVETKDSQRRTKRLRRAGLDVTNNNNKRQRVNETDEAVTQEGTQRLNLWVPTTSLFPHWAHLSPNDNEDNPRKISGLSEIHCVISSIRPVLLS